LKALAGTRATQRKARKRRDLWQVALVGYTNAGKSTLLNRLTHADVLVQDQLFSTLDPTVRRLHLPGGETVLVSDTVGFVRRLPHQLVEAFQSTLEEVRDADLLLHAVDASAPDADERIAAVDTVLREIGADAVPRLLAWTKADIAPPDDLKMSLATHPGSVALSAATGEGVPELLTTIGDRLRALTRVVELVVPYDRGDVLAALHRAGEVLVEMHVEDGTRVRARLPVSANGRFAEFSVAAE
jgi:GTP-binding protein HflX